MIQRARRGRFALAVAIGLVTATCGGATSAPPAPSSLPAAPAPSPAPPPLPLTAIVSVNANGVSPQEVTIAIGGRVTFVNNDVRPHDMVSDPHHLHTECPEVNPVGFLTPGQSRDIAVFGAARDCGYHDHIQPIEFKGRIVVR